MKRTSKGASTPIAAPILKAIRGITPVHQWDSWKGLTYSFEETEETIRRSGFVPEWMPYPSARKGSYIRRSEPHFVKLARLGDGRLRLCIDADCIMARDADFRRFLGSLLADSRLSLVKGESV
jgi:hypothetical protein